MKFIKWKTLIVSCILCLVPILLGVSLWESLPDTIAIHFDINNEPDNFASKGFVVFAIPFFMALLQAFCCFINDINAHKHGERKKFERITKSIIPIITFVMYIITLGYSLGWNIDIRKAVALIVGSIFLVTGNYMPKLDYIKNHDIDSGKARRINRFIGFETVVMGVLFIVSIMLPPIATVLCLVLMIPYAVIAVIYGVTVTKKG